MLSQKAPTTPPKSSPSKKDAKKDVKDKDEKEKDAVQLSEEDLLLQSQLHDSVSILVDPTSSSDIRMSALTRISTEVQSATGSMTSVPKPLKFLKPKHPTLVAYFKTLQPSDAVHRPLASLLSALSMTMDTTANLLSYRLIARSASLTKEPVDLWGHEYVRSLTGAVGSEWSTRIESFKPTVDLRPIVDDMVTYYLTKSGESAAVDLLVETCGVGGLAKALEGKDVENVGRLTLYLIKTSEYVGEEEVRV